jgi:hypothetical protein
MNLTNRVILVALLAILSVPIASPAQAYLDPGTGSMILQIVLGGVAGILVAGKLYWSRLKEFFGFSTGDAETTEESTDSNAD